MHIFWRPLIDPEITYQLKASHWSTLPPTSSIRLMDLTCGPNSWTQLVDPTRGPDSLALLVDSTYGLGSLTTLVEPKKQGILPNWTN